MGLEQVYGSRSEISVRSGPLGLRHLVPLALAVVACAVAYAGTVGLLYLQNQMWAVPLSEISSGAYDPKELLHPRGDALLGFLAIMLTPLVAGTGLALTGLDVSRSLREGRTRRQVAPAVAVFALSAVVLLAYLAVGPLSSWYLD